MLTKEIIYNKTSQELTAFLYEGLLDHLEAAVELIESKTYIEANRKLQKANDILYRLGIGLKYEAGPIAEQLDALYNFMAEELIAANLKKDAGKIRGVITIVQQIAEAWNTALKSSAVKQVNPKGNAKMAAYESSIMRS